MSCPVTLEFLISGQMYCSHFYIKRYSDLTLGVELVRIRCC